MVADEGSLSWCAAGAFYLSRKRSEEEAEEEDGEAEAEIKFSLNFNICSQLAFIISKVLAWNLYDGFLKH